MNVKVRPMAFGLMFFGVGLIYFANAKADELEVDVFWQIQSQYASAHFDKTAPNNPENQIFQFNQRSGFIELQPEVLINWQDASLHLSPRATFQYAKAVINDNENSLSNSDYSLRYWHFEYYYHDFWLKAGRFTNLWGPARMVSPSNRYHVDSNRSNPEIELDARDFIEVGATLSSQWQTLLTVNVGEGEQHVADFKTTADLQLQWVGNEWSNTVILSKTAMGYGIGGYAQWTVNDALLLYTDMLFQNKAKTINDRQLALEATIDDEVIDASSSKVRDNFSIVSGLSYTLENGFNITFDYLYNHRGLAQKQLFERFKINNQYTNDILTGQASPEKVSFVTETNQLAAYTISAHYLFTMLQQNDVIADTDFSLLWITSLNDNSDQITLNFTHRANNNMRLYSSFSWFSGSDVSGGHVTDLGRFLEDKYSVGIKYLF